MCEAIYLRLVPHTHTHTILLSWLLLTSIKNYYIYTKECLFKNNDRNSLEIWVFFYYTCVLTKRYLLSIEVVKLKTTRCIRPCCLLSWACVRTLSVSWFHLHGVFVYQNSYCKSRILSLHSYKIIIILVLFLRDNWC